MIENSSNIIVSIEKMMIMVRGIIFMILLICVGSLNAQIDKRIVRIDRVEDISDSPIYPKLITNIGEETIWKERYKYLDSIDINWIIYMSDGLRVEGLLIQPKKPGKYPCVIYNRGGNRDFGKLTIAKAATFLGRLANEGYIVIASNYRGGGNSEGMEEFGGRDVNDIINLIDVLGEVEDADTSRIGMYGWSRGGMMTYIASTKTDRIKAIIVGGAISNLTMIDRPEMEEYVYSQLIPNYWKNKEEELKKRSAVFWVDRFSKEVPVLMLHGNADWRVLCSNSLNMAMEFDKYRIPYRLKIYEGADHGINEFDDDVDMEVFSWFDRFLKKGEGFPDMEFHGK